MKSLDNFIRWRNRIRWQVLSFLESPSGAQRFRQRRPLRWSSFYLPPLNHTRELRGRRRAYINFL